MAKANCKVAVPNYPGAFRYANGRGYYYKKGPGPLVGIYDCTPGQPAFDIAYDTAKRAANLWRTYFRRETEAHLLDILGKPGRSPFAPRERR